MYSLNKAYFPFPLASTAVSSVSRQLQVANVKNPKTTDKRKFILFESLLVKNQNFEYFILNLFLRTFTAAD